MRCSKTPSAAIKPSRYKEKSATCFTGETRLCQSSRSTAKVLAKALENEHPQAIGVVLAELDAKKSSEVLSLLGEGVRLSVIGRMTSKETVSIEAKLRIAKMVNERLKALTGAAETTAASPAAEQSLRKVAVILRNLGKELRDGLLGAIKEKDASAADKVAELMIIWEDITACGGQVDAAGAAGYRRQKTGACLEQRRCGDKAKNTGRTYRNEPTR